MLLTKKQISDIADRAEKVCYETTSRTSRHVTIENAIREALMLVMTERFQMNIAPVTGILDLNKRD